MSTQYATPIPQQMYTQVGLISSIVGFFILAYFFIYQGAYKTHQRSIVMEGTLAFLASAGIGMGIFLNGLSVGIYM